jgi:D-alanine-D-alanine ligase
MIYFKTSAPFLVACPTIPVEADSDDEPPSFAADASTVEVAAIIVDTLHRLGFSARLVSVAGDSHEEINASHRVFNLMEGDAADPAREVRFAAWMEARNIPFTGNPAAALSLALRKDLARERLAARRVPIAQGVVAHDARFDLRGLRGPWFVKPAAADGSIGVDEGSAVADEPALRARVAWLQKHLGGACLIERYLPGAEVNVSLFPDRRGELQVALSALDFSACPPGTNFVTYSCKWDPDSPAKDARSVPAADLVSRATLARAEEIGRAAFAAMGCRGYARIDMRLDERGEPHVIDVNPNPDLDPGAGFSLSAGFLGISHEELIGRIAAQATRIIHANPPRLRRRPRAAARLALPY